MYAAVVMIEKNICRTDYKDVSDKQDRESVITPEHCTIESYFEEKIVYTSVYRKKVTRKHSGAHFDGAIK